MKEVKNKREMTSVDDPIVREVIDRIEARSLAGIKKYGVSMTRPDITTEEWIDNTIEELLDAAVYLTRVRCDLAIAKSFRRKV